MLHFLYKICNFHRMNHRYLDLYSKKPLLLNMEHKCFLSATYLVVLEYGSWCIYPLTVRKLRKLSCRVGISHLKSP